MRQTAIVAVTLALLAALSACRREDVRTAYIHVPEMKDTVVVNAIRAELAKVPGVQADKMDVDMTARTIRVPYDSIQLSLKNIEFVVAESGYSANDVPAKR